MTPDSPAAGKLETRDRILTIDGKQVPDASAVSKAVERAGAGTPMRFEVRRDGRTKTVTVVPAKVPGQPGKARVGIVVGEGYRFPFDVAVKIPDRIGGPSAGLIFSLAIYDALTPGSLTGGNDVAGTGTISRDGSVGPIGGIQQKIVAAADAGAKLFLVPPANCRAALNADVKKDEIRLVEAPTMHSAVRSLTKYAADPSATLPKCG